MVVNQHVLLDLIRLCLCRHLPLLLGFLILCPHLSFFSFSAPFPSFLLLIPSGFNWELMRVKDSLTDTGDSGPVQTFNAWLGFACGRKDAGREGPAQRKPVHNNVFATLSPGEFCAAGTTRCCTCRKLHYSSSHGWTLLLLSGWSQKDCCADTNTAATY